MATTAVRPRHTPEKAHQPAPAAASGRPRKAHKPAAAARASGPAKSGKPSRAARPGRPTGADRKTAGRGSAPGSGAKGTAAKAAKVGKPVGELVKAAAPGHTSMSGKATLEIAKFVARRALSSRSETVSRFARRGFQGGALAARTIRTRAIELSSTSAEAEAVQRPPIQAAVDVAVPNAVAWREWMRLEWLPEGVDRVSAIERTADDELAGHLDGGETNWTAQILDERDGESFAWESREGSDCAGLITFHALAERLTRIELSLDVHPVSLAQAVALTARRADRRAAADLRRFKARLELISPDGYEDGNEQDVLG